MMATGKLGITVPFGQVTCCNRTEKKVLQPMNTQARHPNSHSCTPPPYQERGRKEEKLMDQGKDRKIGHGHRLLLQEKQTQPEKD